MKISTFMFNWRGQYEKTKEKIAQLNSIGINPIVINSDEAHEEKDWYNIGETAYFTDQMIVALDVFDKSDADIFCHIQADASYDDWKSLYDDAKKYFKKYHWGVYAPNVDYTWYDSTRTDVPTLSFEENNLKMVGCTDCTCWFIHRDIIEDFKKMNIDMKPYTMGWGWDLVFPAIAFHMQRPVIRDYAHTIRHPQGTNYNKEQAELEMAKFFTALPLILSQTIYYIKHDRIKLVRYFLNMG